MGSRSDCFVEETSLFNMQRITVRNLLVFLIFSFACGRSGDSRSPAIRRGRRVIDTTTLSSCGIGSRNVTNE